KPEAKPMIICGANTTAGPPYGSSSIHTTPTAAPITVTATPALIMTSTPYRADQRPAAKLPTMQRSEGSTSQIPYSAGERCMMATTRGGAPPMKVKNIAELKV